MRKNIFLMLTFVVIILGVIIARGIIPANAPQQNIPENGDADNTASDLARELYQLRNPYIGDVSANSRILSSLLSNEVSVPFHMELETRETPYVLRVIFEEMPENPAKLDSWMSGQGLMILALIDNADEVQWAYPLEMGGEPVVSSARVTREDLFTALDLAPETFQQTPEIIDLLLALKESY